LGGFVGKLGVVPGSPGGPPRVPGVFPGKPGGPLRNPGGVVGLLGERPGRAVELPGRPGNPGGGV
jgi:hypothetical protein